jgi:hypothetical protein
MQATLRTYLTGKYRTAYPDEFVDVNLSLNQTSSGSGETQEEAFVFVFVGLATFHSGPNGFPSRSDVLNLQADFLSDTDAITVVLRQNDTFLRM